MGCESGSRLGNCRCYRSSHRAKEALFTVSRFVLPLMIGHLLFFWPSELVLKPTLRAVTLRSYPLGNNCPHCPERIACDSSYDDRSSASRAYSVTGAVDLCISSGLAESMRSSDVVLCWYWWVAAVCRGALRFICLMADSIRFGAYLARPAASGCILYSRCRL